MATGSEQRRWHERRLERTLLRTYRDDVDLYEILPNDKQPRKGPKKDLELQRQIEANGAVFEPLLLEPHPIHKEKFRIIDGDRRWENSRVLVENEKKEQFRILPAEITDHTLTDEERFRVWVYIHRQRKEWDAKEKEMVAYQLVNLAGRASAANILGITVRDLDKLVEVYELSERLTNLPEPGASITWAREIKNINRKLLTPSVLDTIIQRINENEITNSKDIRKLRQVLRDPIAKDEFLSESGSLESALHKVGPSTAKKENDLLGDIEELTETLQRYPWTILTSMKGDARLLRKLDEAETLLKDLRRALGE